MRRLTEAQADLLDSLVNGGRTEWTIADLMEDTGRSRVSVSRALKSLEAGGLAMTARTTTRQGPPAALWRATMDGVARLEWHIENGGTAGVGVTFDAAAADR